ncbi:phosphoribosylamine--glycine ligase [Ornithinibacillus massiliensis]|uniref:Phosphoribosylamine--glycine ligase n=1 Tax=Ornithinibacillus massiliensis TaxID=1944633 RepID=A0ABS5MFP0_9BACI|nr:phosphoribosylamine--glycine ligase [Ornithinibacillus massiliensis]MBS3681146.1 phosphoribosylamine--glycine ligase [Ornithinibacillus massiliensis]
MNVLVIGRGGREHSIVMKLSESKLIDKLFVAPGNAGMENVATCVPIEETETMKLIHFAKEHSIELTIVGPENPLLDGIANEFLAEGLSVFAPTKEAALIEGSKSFAKEIMKKYQIPTASYETFTDAEKAKAYVIEKGAPIVIKADGLAAGKGVVVAETTKQAIQAIDDMLVSKAFSEAGAKVVVEEFLMGNEFSLMAFVHGEKVCPMIPARDHKRAFDHDEGPNTGGMGAYAPVPDITEEAINYATKEILQKAASGLVAEGRSFTGILYAGLIMTAEGPKVIEFNARFGDPETQVVLPLLKNDLIQVLVDVLSDETPQLEWEEQSCLGVVLASDGYPGSYQKGVLLPNLYGESFIVYAGVDKTDNGFVSNGGRVLLVGAKSTTLENAGKLVYESLPANKDLEGFFYRTDIGKMKEDALS